MVMLQSCKASTGMSNNLLRRQPVSVPAMKRVSHFSLTSTLNVITKKYAPHRKKKKKRVLVDSLSLLTSVRFHDAPGSYLRT